MLYRFNKVLQPPTMNGIVLGMMPPRDATHTILSLELNDPHVVRRKPDIEQERQVAMGDLLRENYFAPKALPEGGYYVQLGVIDNRLVFSITNHLSGDPLIVKLPVTPFRSIIRDYFMICESYFEAVASADPYKVEAVDMGRRGVHNEGSELLRKQLREDITMDFDTARRLFTLMCVLHIR